MTNDNGPAVAGDRAAEVADYVEDVREALADLPPSERDDLLEDLRAHLTEVAADDPAPLRERLGPPAAYAAEFRAAADPAAELPRHTIGAWAKTHAERWQGRLRRLDVRVGPVLGYARASEFGRLLRPAWWVLRGYLAAMLVVTVLDRSGPGGLLPRLGGSTLAGLIILAGFVAGSVWLAHRETGLDRWPRRAVLAGSAVLVLFGVIGFASVDDRQRWGVPQVVVGHHGPPPASDRFEHVEDVYVFDQHGQLLTGVRLLDQAGEPIDIGWEWCGDETPWDPSEITYPRCPEEAPWWVQVQAAEPTATPEPSAEPSGTPAPKSPSPSPAG